MVKAGVQSVSITALSVSIDSFVNLSGNFAFQKIGRAYFRERVNNVVATVGASKKTVGVTGGTLALLLKDDGKVALEASGALSFTAGRFASATATSVKVKWNSTTTDYSASAFEVSV